MSLPNPGQPNPNPAPLEPGPGQAAAAAVSIKLPPFWPADPELWIAQVEAQFRTRNITQDGTKYDYIIGSLNPETATEIRDVLLNPPEENKYAAIRAALLKRSELSDQKRLQELLSREDLGDRKPTQVIRRMRQLVGETLLDPKVLRTLFIQKLPLSVQQIMVTVPEEMTLENMAEMAERIMEVTTPGVNKLSVSNSENSEVAHLREEVNDLKRMIKDLSINQRHRSNSRGARQSSRGRSPFRRRRDVNKHPFCWYHHRFGENSNKCEDPCEWKADSKNGGRSPSK